MADFSWKNDLRVDRVDVPASLATERGYLTYYDTATENHKPASSQTDAGSEVLNQRNFAQNFSGVSLDKRLSTQTTADEIEILSEGLIYIDAVSADYDYGELLGAVETSGGDALEPFKVTKVTDPALAIGTVFKNTGSSATAVWMRFKGRRGHLDRKEDGGAGQPFDSTSTTASGTVTLTVDSNRVQVIDPGGAGRNVVLPDEAASKNLEFRIHNAADDVEILTIKASNGSTTVCTPTQNESAIVYCDGVTWRGIVGANN